MEALLAAFFLTFLSELADKTQLLILGLALKYKSPWRVFIGALSAHVIMDLLAIILGVFFGKFFSSVFLSRVVGILFILLGAWGLAKIFLFPKKKKKKQRIHARNPLLYSFLFVLASEFGDKTQIASGLLTVKYLQPVIIFLGVFAALIVVIGLNVFIESKIAEKIPRRTLKIIVALLFIGFGSVTVLF